MELSKKPKDWLNRKLEDPEFRKEFETEWASLRFIEDFESALEREEQTKSGVARKLGKSRSFITQCLHRGRNLTIKTMVELAGSLGYELKISMEKRSPQSASFDVTLESFTVWHFESEKRASRFDPGLTWPSVVAYPLGAHEEPSRLPQEDQTDDPVEGVSPVLMWEESSAPNDLVH